MAFPLTGTARSGAVGVASHPMRSFVATRAWVPPATYLRSATISRVGYFPFPSQGQLWPH